MANVGITDLYECREEDCKARTNLGFEQVLRLTGIYGVHPDFDYKKYASNCSILYKEEERQILVSIRTEIIGILKLVINLNRGEISIDLLEKADSNVQNVALNLIASIVDGVKACEIDLMYLYAAFENSDGFIVWGLVGFIPIEAEVNQLIENLISEFNQKSCSDTTQITSFYKLLVNPEGRKLWMENGIGWTGEFSIREHSESMVILSQEIQRKQQLFRKREEVIL